MSLSLFAFYSLLIFLELCMHNLTMSVCLLIVQLAGLLLWSRLKLKL